MRRFNQGSVHPSNLQVGRPGKGWTAASHANKGFVQPPNLVLPFPLRSPVRRRVRARAHVYVYTYRLDKVRRLDGFNKHGGLQPSNLCLTS